MRNVWLIAVALVLSLPARAERVVRFWVGSAREATTREAHLKFIAETLVPSTLVAGHGGLIYYSIYIPRADKPPRGAHLSALPFTEVALPTYSSADAYSRARARRPLYGPLHFEPNGFDAAVSYSAVPKELDESEIENGVKISKNEKEPPGQIAYDLRPGLDADWRVGTTLVWLLLRKRDVSEEDYTRSVARHFARLRDDDVLSKTVDGHYARVEEGYVLHFINVPDRENPRAIPRARRQLEALAGEHLIPFDLVVASAAEPYTKDWYELIAPGKAVNVRFVPGLPSDLGIE